jgi:hypothetical protein
MRKTISCLFTLLVLTSLQTTAQIVIPNQMSDEASKRIAPAMVTILVRGNSDDRFEVAGSGVLVRGDGVLLTAYHLVQGAREIQVRLANGETFDKVEIIATDPRRNIAALKIYATPTPFVIVGALNESIVGVPVRAVHGGGGQQVAAEVGGVVSSISLADEIPGAGTGYRVLKFSSPVREAAAGGVLVDDYGRALGLIAPLPQARMQSYAVPLYNVIGLARSAPAAHPGGQSFTLVQGPPVLNRAIPMAQSSTTPLEQMPPVAVPQRPTTALAPAGPGSVVIRETDPAKILVGSRTLHVTSRSNLFKTVQLLNELRKRHELTDWNLSLVDESEVADLILEIEHVPLTWEFPFKIKHQRTGVVITAGKVYAWGGGDGAQLMASRVIERLMKLRASVKAENNATPK